VQRLPMVIICENNGYSFSTPLHRQTAVKQLVDKAAAYGIPGVRADGNDVLAVYGVTKPAVERAREGGGCTLIELVTYRRKGHAEHDSQSYVPKEELAAWEAKDPIDRCIRDFTAAGWATAAELAEIDRRVLALLDEAVGQCEDEPLPDAGTALDGVLADPARAEREWYRGIHG